MVIMSQTGKTIVRWERIDKAFVSSNPKGHAIIVGFGNADNVLMGTYHSAEQCQRVLGYLFEALKESESSFEFPQPEELPDCKAHYGSTVKTKANRRGGS